MAPATAAMGPAGGSHADVLHWYTAQQQQAAGATPPWRVSSWLEFVDLFQLNPGLYRAGNWA